MTQPLHFIWMEITGKCQLACTHCYAGSGPQGTHGVMTLADWLRVIDQAAELGVRDVQFIGGEPTTHPHLAELIGHARERDLTVEVFSNLVKVTEALWAAFAQPGVRLATSYYSDDPAEHEAITLRRGSHERTKANIDEAIRRSIPLRTGVIDMRDGQRVQGALLQLAGLGVTDVGTDRLRQVGRGERDQNATVDQLCGKCASGVLAVAPDGTVWPCVFSRWLPVGNVQTDSLAAILAGNAVADVRTMLGGHFANRIDYLGEPVEGKCNPDCNPNCSPNCGPKACKPASAPCHPQCGPACQPNCSPGCSPTCNPIACGPRSCWPAFQ